MEQIKLFSKRRKLIKFLRVLDLAFDVALIIVLTLGTLILMGYQILPEYNEFNDLKDVESPYPKTDWAGLTYFKPQGKEGERMGDMGVGFHVNHGRWQRDSSTDLPVYLSAIDYIVYNYGSTDMDDVRLTAFLDGSTCLQKSVRILAHSSFTDRFSISLIYDQIHQISVKALTIGSQATCSFYLEAIPPRSASTLSPETAKLYVTPNDKIVRETLDEISRAYPKVPMWMAIKDWVLRNVQYRSDYQAYGVKDFWNLPRETIRLGAGDCEDLSLLLCSLYRAAGYSQDDTYVILASKGETGHAWTEVRVSGSGWQRIDLTMFRVQTERLGYEAEYRFNDIYFEGA